MTGTIGEIDESKAGAKLSWCCPRGYASCKGFIGETRQNAAPLNLKISADILRVIGGDLALNGGRIIRLFARGTVLWGIFFIVQATYICRYKAMVNARVFVRV